MLKLKGAYSNLNVCLLIVLCVLFSCRQSSKIEKVLITSEKDSIWLLKGTGKDTSIHFGHFQLENGGRARFFMSAVDNKPSAEITGVEGEIKYTWTLDKNDSTLHLGDGTPFKINKLNKDTIFMTQNDQQKFLLIRRYYKPTL
ncbi:hypothetical protein ACFGVS_16165 [Mucilaginibacter sp. AW1-7]|uniref:hypothetical protein n=1 Tax=Mucilaginibacter sp. AW1-7 TaxID=3349874 RepID=UPI003F7392DD